MACAPRLAAGEQMLPGERKSIMLSRVFLVVVAAMSPCCLAGIPPTLYAQDGDSLLTRFRQEGPRAWEQYLARTRRLQGTFTSLLVRLAPKKYTMSEERFEFKQRPGCGLLMRQ